MNACISLLFKNSCLTYSHVLFSFFFTDVSITHDFSILSLSPNPDKHHRNLHLCFFFSAVWPVQLHGLYTSCSLHLLPRLHRLAKPNSALWSRSTYWKQWRIWLAHQIFKSDFSYLGLSVPKKLWFHLIQLKLYKGWI